MASVTSFKSFVETEFGDTTIVGLPGSLAQSFESYLFIIRFSVCRFLVQFAWALEFFSISGLGFLGC